MCLILLDIRTVNGFPVVLGANREEQHARQSTAPAWHHDPRIFAGTDLRAGGTWLGISATGLVVAVTNRREPWQGSAAPRSRGQLCVDALRHVDADKALAWACTQLRDTPYRPCNLLVADAHHAGVVQHAPASEVEPRLAQMAKILADHEPNAAPEQHICRHGNTSGTVSSALLAIPETDLRTAVYHYAPGAPDVHAYADLSLQLQHHAEG